MVQLLGPVLARIILQCMRGQHMAKTMLNIRGYILLCFRDNIQGVRIRLHLFPPKIIFNPMMGDNNFF